MYCQKLLKYCIDIILLCYMLFRQKMFCLLFSEMAMLQWIAVQKQVEWGQIII